MVMMMLELELEINFICGRDDIWGSCWTLDSWILSRYNSRSGRTDHVSAKDFIFFSIFLQDSSEFVADGFSGFIGIILVPTQIYLLLKLSHGN